MRITMIANYRRASFTRSLIAAGLVSVLAAGGQAHAVTTEELAKKLEALEKQNAALQAKVDKLEAAQTQQSSQVRQQAQAVEEMKQSAQPASAANTPVE